MAKENHIGKTKYLVELAVLVAILLLLELTGLGYIKTGFLEFTVMQVPVAIGAILLGPAAGAVLGGVFGLTSFWECFGKSAFGAILLGVNPLSTFVVCFVPRVLMGWLCGLIFRGFFRASGGKIWSYFAASLCGALLNTALFMSALMLLFGNSDYILKLRNGASVLKFVVAMVGVQGLLEAVICCVLGAVISRALYKMTRE